MGTIGDGAVRKATGRTWAEWLALLDRKGARKLDHKGIVALVGEHHPELGGWWRQMVAVEYEQRRGLRRKHEQPEGYQVGGSKTVGVPLARLYRAWSDARLRGKWLADPGFRVRKATKEKSMRITWVDGETHVDANFYAKGAGKSQVAVQHGKLAGPRDAERMKRYWAVQLARMKEVLEA